MALVTAQAFYRIYDDAGVALAEVSQDGTALTTTMQFVNTNQAQADRTLCIRHGLDGALAKYRVAGGLPFDMLIEAHWVDLYGYTAGTVHPGSRFESLDTAGAGSLNHIRATLVGVPVATTYRGTLVVQKIHAIMQ